MAKSQNPDMIDASFNVIKNSADTITYTLCSAQPTTRAEAVTTFMLVSTTLDKAAGLTIGAGSPNGRTMTVAARNGLAVTNAGTGNHVAICDATRLLLVTTTAAQAVSAGGTADIGAWTHNIAAIT